MNNVTLLSEHVESHSIHMYRYMTSAFDQGQAQGQTQSLPFVHTAHRSSSK